MNDFERRNNRTISAVAELLAAIPQYTRAILERCTDTAKRDVQRKRLWLRLIV